MIYQPYQLAKSRLTAQIDNALERRMVVTEVANLDEQDPASEMIYYFLIALRRPPFDRDIILATSRHDPKRNVFTREFVHLGVPEPLLLGEMNVTLEERGSYRQTETCIEELHETVEAVIRCFVCPINQWIGALNNFDLRILLGKRGEVWVVFPQVHARCANIGEKPTWIAAVKVPHCCAEHHDISGRKMVLQYELSHAPNDDVGSHEAPESQSQDPRM
jgi:hypothetical protein